jgi:hypothetical protein
MPEVDEGRVRELAEQPPRVLPGDASPSESALGEARKLVEYQAVLQKGEKRP